jgi:hypothetical protein
MPARYRYTFVTVGFAGEAGLLGLQAHSMQLYCPVDLVDEIIVVDNSKVATSNPWQAGLLHKYGSLAERVRFISGADLAAMPADTDGWWTQQVLKIKVADVVGSERYVLLDAKNHLFTPLRWEFLENEEGLPRLNGYPQFDTPMTAFLKHTLLYLGVDSAPRLEWFTRTTTPFTILTSEARSLVRYMEEREGQPFAVAFLEKKLTEFFLYAGFLELKGMLRSSYDLTQPHCAQIWEHTASEAGCAEAIRKAENSGCPFMAVHRKAIANMDEKAQTGVALFWHAHGLFPSVSDAMLFLRDLSKTFQELKRPAFQEPAGFWSRLLGKRRKASLTNANR